MNKITNISIFIFTSLLFLTPLFGNFSAELNLLFWLAIFITGIASINYKEIDKKTLSISIAIAIPYRGL